MMRIAPLAALAAVGLLSACGGSQPQNLADRCIKEVKPEGHYYYPAGVAAPTVTPGLNGSQAEANAVNACIQSKAAAMRAGEQQAATKASAKDGKLPLPTGYPLMKGDAELWPTLTLQQQKRAMVFLRNGSTIRSSLEPNK